VFRKRTTRIIPNEIFWANSRFWKSFSTAARIAFASKDIEEKMTVVIEKFRRRLCDCFHDVFEVKKEGEEILFDFVMCLSEIYFLVLTAITVRDNVELRSILHRCIFKKVGRAVKASDCRTSNSMQSDLGSSQFWGISEGSPSAGCENTVPSQ
jgi:hypothetical protein